MKTRIIAVYKITNIVDGKVYIGGTIDLERRWWQHRNLLKRGIHKSIYFQEAYDKYGASVFKYEILKILDDNKKLLEWEQLFYDVYEPYKRENGYNVNVNAKDATGRISRPESVIKMRASLSIVLKGVNAGEKNGQCKYTDKTIKKAYLLSFRGYTFKDVANKCGMDEEYCRDVLQGNARKSLYEKYVVPKLKKGKCLTIA